MQKKQQSSLEKLVIFLILVVLINIGLLILLQNQVKTIELLKEQRTQLRNDQKIIASSDEIYDEYVNDIDTILAVFPDESTVLDFLQSMEKISREFGSDSSVQLSSKNPLPEGDKLFLLFTVNLKTDTDRFVLFLEKLENLPYLTRTISISTVFNETEQKRLDASITIKLYVKNPFTAK